jgi:hypothetical protein
VPFATPTRSTKPSMVLPPIKTKLNFSGEGKQVVRLVNFCNKEQVRCKCMKYIKHQVNLPLDQEGKLTFFLIQFSTKDIQASFWKLIGQVGGASISAFTPMPSSKVKLIKKISL